jgi:hypothetical protein
MSFVQRKPSTPTSELDYYRSRGVELADDDLVAVVKKLGIDPNSVLTPAELKAIVQSIRNTATKQYGTEDVLGCRRLRVGGHRHLLVHCDGNHYVYLQRRDDNALMVFDPLTPRVPREEVQLIAEALKAQLKQPQECGITFPRQQESECALRCLHQLAVQEGLDEAVHLTSRDAMVDWYQGRIPAVVASTTMTPDTDGGDDTPQTAATPGATTDVVLQRATLDPSWSIPNIGADTMFGCSLVAIFLLSGWLEPRTWWKLAIGASGFYTLSSLHRSGLLAPLIAAGLPKLLLYLVGLLLTVLTVVTSTLITRLPQLENFHDLQKAALIVKWHVAPNTITYSEIGTVGVGMLPDILKAAAQIVGTVAYPLLWVTGHGAPLAVMA